MKTLPNHGSLIVSLYVDDLLVIGSDEQELQRFKMKMEKQFEMSNLGEMKYFLGLEVYQSEVGIFLNQKKYALDILKKFRMQNCKPVPTPLVLNTKFSKEDEAEKCDVSFYRSLIGSLLYLTASRPDLMYAASLLSRFIQSPSDIHFCCCKKSS